MIFAGKLNWKIFFTVMHQKLSKIELKVTVPNLGHCFVNISG
jgi:hypothetical protein